jgi:sulfur-oxidizing protein SoxA
MKRIYLLTGLALLGLGALVAYTQAQKPLDPFEEAMRQRQMYLETFGVLPGELFAEEGKELFHRKGPSGKTLEACDFGKGPGVLEGVYAILPKYFPDSKRVEDLESRVYTCMQTVQGYKPQGYKRRSSGTRCGPSPPTSPASPPRPRSRWCPSTLPSSPCTTWAGSSGTPGQAQGT